MNIKFIAVLFFISIVAIGVHEYNEKEKLSKKVQIFQLMDLAWEFYVGATEHLRNSSRYIPEEELKRIYEREAGFPTSMFIINTLSLKSVSFSTEPYIYHLKMKIETDWGQIKHLNDQNRKLHQSKIQLLAEKELKDALFYYRSVMQHYKNGRKYYDPEIIDIQHKRILSGIMNKFSANTGSVTENSEFTKHELAYLIEVERKSLHHINGLKRELEQEKSWLKRFGDIAMGITGFASLYSLWGLQGTK